VTPKWLFFPQTETVHFTYTKAEDSGTSLVISGPGWWRANSAYSLTHSVTNHPVPTNSQKPRLRGFTSSPYALIFVDIQFRNESKRDAFVTEVGTSIVTRLTIENNGSTYVGTSDTLANLISAFGSNATLNPTKSGNKELQMVINNSDFSGGTPTDDSTNGWGHNLGLDGDMGVTIEVLTP